MGACISLICQPSLDTIAAIHVFAVKKLYWIKVDVLADLKKLSESARNVVEWYTYTAGQSLLHIAVRRGLANISSPIKSYCFVSRTARCGKWGDPRVYSE